MTEQINSLWELARERTVEGEALRRRVAAIGALTVGFCGLLLAIGLGLIVLMFLAAVVAAAGAAALVALWPWLRSCGGDAIAYVRGGKRATRARLGPLGCRVRNAARTAFVEGRAHCSRLARAANALLTQLASCVARSAQATAIYFARRSARFDAPREAIRLNAAGTQHRRSARYDEAVQCHRQALDILRALGDRRGVALTQSNLALALSHAGDDDWAVGLFEEAAATLGDLGDEEHEAQIMANLGVTHRRHGRREEGDNVLELALSKLSPTSSAYQAIESELRRAS